ncbi:hypothetical protein LWC33_27795 [Pseudonocardia sp. RS11V-5]|uniref:hypothetical protein n=1 Tax=Pseudonocardia terrae TaxID=2905831 RepID=UPI001E4032B7|nr:hypothetical protein [Pseudonocardia terrae]MCE3555243.1 hypothetical protein [Pseudonocardia terrae]
MRPVVAGPAVRAGLWFLAFTEVVVGAWALFAPAWFYVGFPAPGHPWVSLLPPYNEHLVRDVGALSLALTVALVGAALRPERRLTVVVLLAFLTATVPHAVFHSLHLHGFPAVDAVAQTVGFALQLGVGVAVLVATLRVGVSHRRVVHSSE